MSEPSPPTQRPLDPASVQAWLRRSAASDEPPWLHGEVARRMADRLQFIRATPKTVIDWWGHLGASAEPLMRAYPQARRSVVEPTPAMQERSRRAMAAPWWSPRRWKASPGAVLAPDEVPAEASELVWANMMLHAATDPAAVISRWHRALAVDGFVMFSCLGPGTLRTLRDLYAGQGWDAPMAELVDMHDLGDMLVQAGFADPVMDQEVLSLSWDNPDALLRELRTLGGNASPERHRGLRTPRWRARLLSALASLAHADGRIHLEFEIAYGHAFKPTPRIPVSGEARVSLDDMRAMVRNKSPRG